MTARQILLSVALAIGGAAPAAAATIQATYTGTVYSSYDATGVFGVPDTSLDGQAYTLTYLFDTALGVRNGAGPGTYDDVSGGAAVGGAITNPTLSATLSIGGHSQTVAGDYFSQYQICDLSYCGVDQHYAYVLDFVPQLDGSFMQGYLFASAYDGLLDFLPDDLETPFSVVLSSLAYHYGAFAFTTFDAVALDYPVNASGNLRLDQLTVTNLDVAPVPLPAAGLLLTGALSAFGLTRRRRRAA